MKKRFFALSLTLVMVLSSLAGCGGESATDPGTADTNEPDQSATTPVETLKLTYATAEQADMAAGQTSYWVVDQIETRSEGHIDIDHIGESQLGSDGDLIVQLLDGTLDIVAVGTSAFSTYTPLFDAIQAPFLLTGYEDEYKLFTSDEFLDIVAEVEEMFDIKFLGFAENGFRQFATVDHPITCVDDLKGMKLRVINTNILINYMTALGANPTTLAYTEIYSGLQNKVIDGEEINISSCASQKHYDVVNYISIANMYCFPASYWMSGKTYRSISEEDFNLIKECFMDGADRCFDTLLYELDDAFLQECIDAGVEVNYIEGDALKEFQDIAEPFLEEARNTDPKVAAMIDYALSIRGGQ
nr:TRAP transporter substrate-binding protein [uncultured Oscillibacter sp.]